MHASAYRTARQFFEVYAAALPAGTVLEIGSRQAHEGQRTLRSLCPPHLGYLGVDLEPGVNVDIVLIDPYVFPLADASVDIALCTSVFEHCEFFWKLFEEILRVLRPGGLLYVNAPSNGYVHRHPVDCWRFYPDSGVALAEWGRRQGHDVVLLESFISDEDQSEFPEEIWNDFVAVFVNGAREAASYPRRMADLREDYANARRPESTQLLRPNRFPGRSQEEASRWLGSRRSRSERVHLYQIAYSEETWNSVPAVMLPLDNRSNERPDWAEYWPIRRFLQNEILDENAFYGFLSPRFSEKLLVPPEDLIEFIASVADDVEVATFSFLFDHGAIFRNVFEHGEFYHPGLMDLSRKVAEQVLPGVDLCQLVNSSANAIFSNYFAAKPRFWRKWLLLCERVFAMAESPDHPCAAALNRGYLYHFFPGKDTTPAKVFVIERMASLLLATTSDFKVEKFAKARLSDQFLHLPFSLLASLDQLKDQGMNGHPMLLDAFSHIQREILGGEGTRNLFKYWLSGNLALEVGHAPSRGYEHWSSALEVTSQEPERAGIGWILRRIFGVR